LDQFRRDPLCIDHGLIRYDIAMQALFVDTPEDTQGGPEACPRSFTGVAMDLALATPIVIPRPCAHAAGPRGMARMAPTIALPCIGIEGCAAGGHVISHKAVAGSPVGMITAPPALLTRVPRDNADDGGAIDGIGAVSLVRVGAPPGGIRRVRVRCAFSPRVLVQLVGLEGRAHHQVGRGGCIQADLHTLPQRMQLCA
jgi:hypothetical protein